jgi:hypothetical protein
MKSGLQVPVRVGDAAKVHPLEVVEAKPRSRRAGPLFKRSQTHIYYKRIQSVPTHIYYKRIQSNVYREIG